MSQAGSHGVPETMNDDESRNPGIWRFFGILVRSDPKSWAICSYSATRAMSFARIAASDVNAAFAVPLGSVVHLGPVRV